MCSHGGGEGLNVTKFTVCPSSDIRTRGKGIKLLDKFDSAMVLLAPSHPLVLHCFLLGLLNNQQSAS